LGGEKKKLGRAKARFHGFRAHFSAFYEFHTICILPRLLLFIKESGHLGALGECLLKQVLNYKS
jgi:hypothetical protein